MKMQTYRNSDKKNVGITNKLTTALFTIYCIVLFWILLFKLGVRFSYMENRNVNLIPFNEFLMSNGKPDLAEIILNIIVFIPLGIYTGVLFKRWAFVNKLLFFFLVAFMFEALQFVFKIGAFDITDIVTNMSGGLTGLLIFEGIDKIFDNSSRSQKFINAVAAIGTIIMVSLLTLLKLNMLPLRYQ